MDFRTVLDAVLNNGVDSPHMMMGASVSPPPPFCSSATETLPRTEVSSLLSAELGKEHNVAVGNYSFFFLSDCSTYALDSCFALNADSPYGMTLLPDGNLQPEYTGCVTDTGVCGLGCPGSDAADLDTKICIDNKPMKWLLGPDEAVVLILTAPPECKYWSFTSYQMIKYYNTTEGLRTVDPSDSFTSELQEMVSLCPDPPARCQTFASLGSPLNYMDLRESNEDWTGFGEPMAMVLTASKSLYGEIQQALQGDICAGGAIVANDDESSATINGNAVLPLFRAPLPVDLLNLGSSGNDVEGYDVLTMLMRTAYPVNETAMQEYYAQAPVTVLRVSPKTATTSEPDCTTHYCESDVYFKSRVTGQMESGGTEFTTEDLLFALDELGSAIDAAHSHSRETNPSGSKNVITSNFMQPYFETGLDCIKQGTMCNGDCPDTLYPISEQVYDSEFCVSVNPIVLPLGSTLAALAALVVFVGFLCCCGPCYRSGEDEKGDDDLIGREETAPPPNSHEDYEWNTIDSYCSNYCCCLPVATLRKWSASNPARFYGVAVGVSAFVFAVIFVPILCVHQTRGQCDHYATLFEDPTDFYVVYGINHRATGHATYSSINAYDYEHLAGVGAASSEEGYNGSAQVYLGDNSTIANYLYAIRFSRNCYASGLAALPGTPTPSDHCIDIATEGDVALPLDKRIMFIGRMYINPVTGAGPAPNETIFDKVKHFY